jgi:adenosylcobinamide kinase/adenosylcobinamide-phosphate guanylyltransferase
MPLTFITGPVRSGKSDFAEELARRVKLPVTYVATARADAGDPEWVRRIALHAARRPPAWSVLETAAPHGCDFREALAGANASSVMLVDSLGTWLADRMSAQLERVPGGALDADLLEEEACALVCALAACPARTIVVGEETGWGIVPEHASGRLFRDVLGRLNRRLAQEAESAYLVVSGFALPLHELAAERLGSACAWSAVREESGGARKPIVFP